MQSYSNLIPAGFFIFTYPQNICNLWSINPNPINSGSLSGLLLVYLTITNFLNTSEPKFSDIFNR